MGLRALRKKLRNKIDVGDTVTWGLQKVNNVVLEVQAEGVIVDATEQGFSRYFVTWEGGRLGKGPGESPLRLVKKGGS